MWASSSSERNAILFPHKSGLPLGVQLHLPLPMDWHEIVHTSASVTLLQGSPVAQGATPTPLLSAILENISNTLHCGPPRRADCYF